MAEVYKDIIYGLIPALLTFAIYYLASISRSLNELRESFARVLAQIGEHERRLDQLES